MQLLSCGHVLPVVDYVAHCMEMESLDQSHIRYFVAEVCILINFYNTLSLALVGQLLYMARKYYKCQNILVNPALVPRIQGPFIIIICVGGCLGYDIVIFMTE